MPLFTFGQWAPDLPETAERSPDNQNTLRLLTATNVVPHGSSYQPAASATVVTSSLTASCHGAFSCRNAIGNVHWYAGTANHLLNISSDTVAWVTKGAGYALSDDDRWSFAQYGNTIYASALTNDMQFMSLSASGTFAAVSGNPPRFRYLNVIRNFLVGIGSADEPQIIQWSALDNPQSWTVDSVTQADFQNLLGDGGWNRGCVVGLAGSDAVVFQERAVWRMMYVGTPLIFQIDPVEGARGVLAAGSIVQSAGFAFYISEDGFYKFDGNTSVPIGHGKVDDFFFKNVDPNNLHKVTAAADADRPIVMWSFQSGSSQLPDKVLAYNWQSERWSLIESECEVLWRSISRHGASIGEPQVALFTKNHQGAVLSGAPSRATISTAEYQFNPRGRSFVSAIHPIIETGLPSSGIDHRKNVSEESTKTDASSLNAQGFCPIRVDDRLMKVRFTLTSSVTWSNFDGFRLEFTASGVR